MQPLNNQSYFPQSTESLDQACRPNVIQRNFSKRGPHQFGPDESAVAERLWRKLPMSDRYNSFAGLVVVKQERHRNRSICCASRATTLNGMDSLTELHLGEIQVC